MRSRLSQAIAVAVVALSLAATATAQQCIGSFEKTVVLFDDADMSGSYSIGDTVEYTVTLCNNGMTQCSGALTDNLDELLNTAGIDPASLDRVDVPGSAGCPTDGGTLCRKGAAGSPPSMWVDVPTDQCGEDCTAGEPDDLAMIPTFTFPPDPNASIQPGECFFWTIQAIINGPFARDTCLCDVARVDVSTPSNDPNWMSLAPGQGCDDAFTCPAPGTCNTCFKIGGAAPTLRATKCFDTPTAPCPQATQIGGDALVYAVRYENVSGGDATNVQFSDDLTDLGARCSGGLGNLMATCTADAATCGGATCQNAQVMAGVFTADMPTMPPGCVVDVTIDADIDLMTAGTCCNTAAATFNGGAVQSSPACFDIGSADLLTVEKCFDTPATPCTNATQMGGDTIQYAVRYTNSSSLALTNLMFRDDLGSLGASCSGSLANLAASCVADAATCGAATCDNAMVTGTTFTADMTMMPPGCIVDVTIDADIDAATTGTCCNEASALFDGGGARSNTACFDIGVAPVPASKTASPATVATNSMAQFTITVGDPASTSDLTNCTFFDRVDASGCMTLASCDSTTPMLGLDCAPPSTVSSSAPFDVPAGQTQEIIITVNSGATEGDCVNTVAIQCDEGSVTVDGTLAISDTGVVCTMMADDITFPPTTPAKDTRWVYTNTCGPADDRLAVMLLSPVASGQPIDTVGAATSGTLRLYQLDCSCSDRMALVKTGMVPDEVFMTWF